jgi:putative hydrolase of the HAD superfamily
MIDDLQAVLLDVGGVLMVPNPTLVGAVTVAHGGTDDVATLLRSHYAAVAAADDGTTLDWLRYQHQLLIGAGVPDERIDLATEAVTAAYTERNLWDYPLPGARSGLQRLAETGLRLGIVSNSDGTVEQTLRNVELTQVGEGPGVPVEILLDSFTVGVEKPDPAIFAIALKAMEVSASQAIYVGDTRTFDVAGALRAGLHPVHVDPYGDCPEPAAHEHVTGVGELADRLSDRRAPRT